MRHRPRGSAPTAVCAGSDAAATLHASTARCRGERLHCRQVHHARLDWRPMRDTR